MSNEDIVDVSSRETSLRAAKMDGLKTWGWISYALHLVVAVAAVSGCGSGGALHAGQRGAAAGGIADRLRQTR